MVLINQILEGVPAAVMPLIEDVHDESWPAVIEAIRTGMADKFVSRVFNQFGPKAFLELLRNAIAQLGKSGMEARQHRLETYEGLAAASMRLYGADDERTLTVRAFVFETSWTTYENPVAAASALYKRIENHAPALKGQVALVLGHAHLMERSYPAAYEAYRVTAKSAEGLLKNAVDRRVLANLLYLGRYREAHEMADSVLKKPGTPFAGGDVVMSAPSKVESACDELKSTLDWCKSTTPEWIRGLGALSAALQNAGQDASDVSAWFVESLDALEEVKDVEAELGTVLRQLMERGAIQSAVEVSSRLADFADQSTVEGLWAKFNHAALSAQTGIEAALEHQQVFAAKLLALSVKDGSRAYVSHARMLLDNGQSERALEAIEHVEITPDIASGVALVKDCALLATGDAQARERLLTGLNNLKEAGRLVSEDGEYLVGILVGEALGRGDRSAIDLQATFLDAVARQFGEGPPVWTESVNMAGVHAQMGEAQRAVDILKFVISKQVESFGPRYADAIRTRLMLAQVLDSMGDTAGAAKERLEVSQAGVPMEWEPVNL